MNKMLITIFNIELARKLSDTYQPRTYQRYQRYILLIKKIRVISLKIYKVLVCEGRAIVVVVKKDQGIVP